MSTNVIEHGGGKTARWLRERRVRMAVWIALVEGVLFVAILFLGLVYVWAKGDLAWLRRTAGEPSEREAQARRAA